MPFADCQILCKINRYTVIKSAVIKHITPFTTVEIIITHTAAEGIFPSAAKQRVIACIAFKLIVTAVSVEYIGVEIPFEGITQIGTGNIFNIYQEVISRTDRILSFMKRQIYLYRGIGIDIVCRITRSIVCTAVDDVISHTAADQVVTCATRQGIIRIHTVECVVSLSPGKPVFECITEELIVGL